MAELANRLEISSFYLDISWKSHHQVEPLVSVANFLYLLSGWWWHFNQFNAAGNLQISVCNDIVTRRSKIVGVVGDVRRDMEGHHYAEKCSVFGISAEELKVLHRCFKCQLPSPAGSLEL